jgi:hypothetical protein
MLLDTSACHGARATPTLMRVVAGMCHAVRVTLAINNKDSRTHAQPCVPARRTPTSTASASRHLRMSLSQSNPHTHARGCLQVPFGARDPGHQQ